MKIIPAIDIIDGKCVRLLKGDYSQMTHYEPTPVQMALEFEQAGADKIHLVDLDGAREKKIVNIASIQSVCAAVKIPVEVGGGIRSREDIAMLLQAGVAQVIIGSLAVKDPDLVAQFISEFGSEKIIIGIDALDGIVKVSGWLEGSSLTTDQLIEGMIKIGVRNITVTDISRDGTLTSPNFQMVVDLVKKYSWLNIVSSGGVSSAADVERLKTTGVSGVIIGKALYEGHINLKELCS